MSTLSQRNLASGCTTTGAPTATVPVSQAGVITLAVMACQDLSAISLWMIATSTATLTAQVTNDPQGLVGWTNVAYREPGGGAYATTAISLTAATGRSIFLDPTDNIQWVRLNITANAGSVTAKGMGER